mgnify:CR=1 FL=1
MPLLFGWNPWFLFSEFSRAWSLVFELCLQLVNQTALLKRPPLYGCYSRICPLVGVSDNAGVPALGQLVLNPFVSSIVCNPLDLLRQQRSREGFEQAMIVYRL